MMASVRVTKSNGRKNRCPLIRLPSSISRFILQSFLCPTRGRGRRPDRAGELVLERAAGVGRGFGSCRDLAHLVTLAPDQIAVSAAPGPDVRLGMLSQPELRIDRRGDEDRRHCTYGRADPLASRVSSAVAIAFSCRVSLLDQPWSKIMFCFLKLRWRFRN